jgi:ParB-like chromosome segregation protein Spo0J
MIHRADVLPYANNPKSHPDEQVEEIMASISQFGFVNPVLLDGDNCVIAGHGRLAAAERLGIEWIPAIRLKHLSAEQVIALRIADNAIPAKGVWNAELLEEELATLRNVQFDLGSLGLDDIKMPEIEDVLTAPPKTQRAKTTIFVSVKNEDVNKARKAITAALDKVRVQHNL